MNFNTAVNWIKRNFKVVIPSILIVIFTIFLFFGGSAPNSNIPGGGFGTLVLAGLAFFGAHKAGEGKIRLALNSVATVLSVVAVWPRVFPLINFLGLAPNIIMILAILVGIWMFKGGKGFFAWRMFLLIFLVLCWIGANGKLFKDGFNAFLSSTGIEMKIPDIKIETPKALKGMTSHLSRIVDQQVSQSKERWVKKDAKLYKYNGSFSPNAVVDTDSIKVFLLGEQVEKDGLTFEKVRLNDPAVGEEFWIYSGDLLTYNHPSATSNGNKNSSSSQWEKMKDISLPFTGRIFNETAGPDGEKIGTGEVNTGLVLENGYDYKITFSGTYSEWFTSDPWFDNISWTGWNPQSAGMKKPFPSHPYGALTLRISDKDGLHPKKGEDFIIFTPNGDNKVFAELNINRELVEYVNPKIGRKIKNSTLSLKVERRPI